MKDPGFALEKAYTELLKDLSYGGQKVKLYSLLAQSGAKAPYVILGPWVSQSDNTKNSFGRTGQINLDVVTRFGVGIASRSVAADIANQITALLKPTPTAEVLNIEGFQSWNTVIVTTLDLTQPTDTDTIIRKIITVQHEICQH